VASVSPAQRRRRPTGTSAAPTSGPKRVTESVGGKAHQPASTLAALPSELAIVVPILHALLHRLIDPCENP